MQKGMSLVTNNPETPPARRCIGIIGEEKSTLEDLFRPGKCISDYGDFASIDADPIAFIFRFADGSRGMQRCADVFERAIWEIRHLTGCK
jgi:hypothetical protein